MVEPFLGHLRDEKRRFGHLLPRHDQARVRDANVEPLTQNHLFVSKLGVTQELKMITNFRKTRILCRDFYIIE